MDGAGSHVTPTHTHTYTHTHTHIPNHTHDDVIADHTSAILEKRSKWLTVVYK